jgi:hypothetical protein
MAEEAAGMLRGMGEAVFSGTDWDGVDFAAGVSLPGASL